MRSTTTATYRSLSTLVLATLALSPLLGQVMSHQKISDLEGGLSSALRDGDRFGFFLAPLGDLDGDGVIDLAVGTPGDDDGGDARGAVWIVFLERDGTVRAAQKISDLDGGFTGVLADGDEFGHYVANLGDIDGDGLPELGVSATLADDGGPDRGALWILFLEPDGTVRQHQKISQTEGGFLGALDDGDEFAHGVTSLGDLDLDGTVDIAAGADHDDDGGENRGAVWILFLNGDGTVREHQKISALEGGFEGALDDGDLFGHDIDGIGDFDGDGVPDLMASATRDDDGGENRGAAWMLFLNVDGTVRSHLKISDTEGNFLGELDDGDFFGHPAVAVGDLDGDAVTDFAFGAPFDDDGGRDHGAFWILLAEPDGTVREHRKVSDTRGGFAGVLDDDDQFAHSVVSIGDLDGDDSIDFAVGAYGDDDGGGDRGAVWILFGGERDRPVLTVRGHCDDQSGDNVVVLKYRELTPFSSVATFLAEVTGSTTLVSGPCPGTELDLDAPRIVLVAVSDEKGRIDVERSIGPRFCGDLLQMIDSATCLTSGVVALPD